MRSITQSALWLSAAVGCLAALPAAAQSFRVQCPTSTITHPDPTNSGVNSTDRPPYNGPTQFARPATGTQQWAVPTANVNGGIKCQQISGGDGYSTMADGTQTFMFAFGPLSGLAEVAAGHPGTQFPNVFNTVYTGTLVPGDPATTDGATAGNAPGALGAFTYNGAVGLAPDVVQTVTVANLLEGHFPATTPATTAGACPNPTSATTVTGWADTPTGFVVGQQITI